MSDNNIIPVDFTKPVREEILRMIDFEGGVDITEKRLIEIGFHPSFVKAFIKKIIKDRGK